MGAASAAADAGEEGWFDAEEGEGELGAGVADGGVGGEADAGAGGGGGGEADARARALKADVNEAFRAPVALARLQLDAASAAVASSVTSSAFSCIASMPSIDVTRASRKPRRPSTISSADRTAAPTDWPASSCFTPSAEPHMRSKASGC